MHIPEKIKFLGHEYSVEQVCSNQLDGANGESWYKLCKIRIDKDIPQTRKESVLLHEIVECIDAHFDLKLNHTAIECLEEALYLVLKENKLHFDEQGE